MPFQFQMQALAVTKDESPRARGVAPEASRPLRVLQVGKFYPPHKGGMESHLHALCGQLRGRVEVEVLVSSDTRETTEEILDSVKVTRAGTLFDFAAAP